MPKATEKLLADHRLIRKVMEGFHPENPRFGEIAKTLHRTVVGHAWFEDAIFLPALEHRPFLEKSLSREIVQEHIDIDELLTKLRRIPPQSKLELEAAALQLRVILDTHFKKEEDGLFPLAEKILDVEGLNQLGDEMENRKMEVRSVVAKLG